MDLVDGRSDHGNVKSHWKAPCETLQSQTHGPPVLSQGEISAAKGNQPPNPIRVALVQRGFAGDTLSLCAEKRIWCPKKEYSVHKARETLNLIAESRCQPRLSQILVRSWLHKIVKKSCKPNIVYWYTGEPISGECRHFSVILLRGFCFALFIYVRLSMDTPFHQFGLGPCQALWAAQL